MGAAPPLWCWLCKAGVWSGGRGQGVARGVAGSPLALGGEIRQRRKRQRGREGGREGGREDSRLNSVCEAGTQGIRCKPSPCLMAHWPLLAYGGPRRGSLRQAEQLAPTATTSRHRACMSGGNPAEHPTCVRCAACRRNRAAKMFLYTRPYVGDGGTMKGPSWAYPSAVSPGKADLGHAGFWCWWG